MTDKIGADKDRLARRAVAAMGGWQTGMVDTQMRVCVEASDPADLEPGDTELVRWTRGHWKCTDYLDPGDAQPDPESPATQGCLFARVREVHGVSEIEAVGYILDLMVTRACGYAEALVIGLEAGR